MSLESIFSNPTVQNNYSIFMAGLDQDNQIHAENEKEREALQADQSTPAQN